MNLDFYLDGQKLLRCDDKEIAGYSRNYIYVTIDFDHNWKDLEKYALFVTPELNRYVVYLGYGKTLSCAIPNPVLEGAFFRLSVFAGDLLTSTQQTILISSSGYIPELDELDGDSIIQSNTYDLDIIPRNNYDDDYETLRRKKFIEDEHPYV